MNSLKIVTIDDNDSIRLSIASYLEDLGYEVLDAESGEEGIEIIDRENPDIVLTDTHMPGLSGIDVLNYVKENKDNIPVIVISGAGEIESVVEALRAGAWDYITKPIEDLSFLSYSIDKVIKRVNLVKDNREKSLEIENKNRELEKTVKELQNTQKELVEAEKMASLGYMVSGVAHEINTPLGICLTSTSYLRDETRDIISLNDNHEMKLSNFTKYTENVSELCELINTSLESIKSLITNFKQLSVDQQEDIKKNFLIKDSIKSLISLVLTTYTNKDVEYNITGDDIEINCYPEVLNRIFFKLTENAVIHGFKNQDKGKIEVDVRSEEDRVIVDFQNNGAKIPKNLLGKIFDPFVTENKTMGTGLGLCIAYNLVTFKLMGDIVCKNTEDGVSFVISFPV